MLKDTGQYPLLDITTNKLTFSDNDRQELSDIYRGYYYEFNKAERIKRCGKTEFIYKCSCCGETKKLQFYCELRTCPVCAGKMTSKLYNELLKLIDLMKLNNEYGNYAGFRHLVLTIPVNHLKTDIKKAQKQVLILKRFFNNKWNFKYIIPGKPGNGLGRKQKKVYIGKKWGGIAGLEIGQKSGMVHYHILLYCPYIDVDEIRKVWKIGYVKLNRIKSEKYKLSALKNIVMYVVNFSKMSKSGNMSMKRIAEIEMSMKGLRRVKTFGIFYNRVKMKVKKKFLCQKCNVEYTIVGVKENGIQYSLFSYAVCVSDYFKYITGKTAVRMP